MESFILPLGPIINKQELNLYYFSKYSYCGFKTCFAPSTCNVGCWDAKHISNHDFRRHFEKGERSYNLRYLQQTTMTSHHDVTCLQLCDQRSVQRGKRGKRSLERHVRAVCSNMPPHAFAHPCYQHSVVHTHTHTHKHTKTHTNTRARAHTLTRTHARQEAIERSLGQDPDDKRPAGPKVDNSAAGWSLPRSLFLLRHTFGDYFSGEISLCCGGKCGNRGKGAALQRSRGKALRSTQGTLQSGPAAPVGSQHSCQPTVKRHIWASLKSKMPWSPLFL